MEAIAIRDRVKELRRVKASELQANPKNWREHPTQQRDALRGILEEVGIAGALLARETEDGTLQLIDGHLRAEDDPDIEWPVLVLDVNQDEADKLLLTHDPLSAMAETNKGLLDTLLKECAISNEAVNDMLTDLAKDAGCEWAAEPEIVEDEVPEPPAEPITKRGQLWILGENRLLCGDATKADEVARLMNGERAGLMNTDPPYGISFDNAALGETRREYTAITNDDLADEKLQAFLESCFRIATSYALEKNAAWYLWHAHLTQGYFAAAAAAANVVLHRQIIWVKPRLILGRGNYHWKHEPCFMGWVDGCQPPDYGEGAGERTQTTVWEIDGVNTAERREYEHATPKPIRLFAIPMIKHLKPGEIAFEPFAGSGPQIIAATQLGRRCFAMDIEPRYTDVCIARWEKLTGHKATLAS